MLAYALRRAAWAVLLCLILSLFTFLIFYVVPRGENTQRTRGRLADIQRTQQFTGPVFVQYGQWVSGVAHGSLGRSYVSRRPVSDIIRDTLEERWPSSRPFRSGRPPGTGRRRGAGPCAGGEQHRAVLDEQPTHITDGMAKEGILNQPARFICSGAAAILPVCAGLGRCLWTSASKRLSRLSIPR